MLSLIVAILQALPVLKSFFNELVSIWVAIELENMKKEHRDAIKKAINQKDQRDLEASLGVKNPGGASGLPGTELGDGNDPAFGVRNEK